MTANAPRHDPTLGFITVCEYPEQGWFGGYLVLNANGRPLEFHCTAPVKPSRPQEILYGATLKPYVFGEQIGVTLIRKGRMEPAIVCTDVAPMLTLRDAIEAPVALIRTEASQFPPPGTVEMKLGPHAAALPTAWATDRERLEKIWPSLACHFDLKEPFARIRGAIDEARRAAAA